MDDRPLPKSLEAERSVLGAILLDGELFDTASGALSSADFSLPEHGMVWQAMTRLRQKGMAIDYGTVRESLVSAKQLEAVGAPYLLNLVDGVPRASNVEHYAQVVREKATLRNLVIQAQAIVEEAMQAPEDVAAVLEAAERKIMALGRGQTKGDFVVASDWMREMYAHVEKASTQRRAVTGVPTGITELDRMTRGLQPADLIYVGARPSTGKTSLALQMALEASRHVMTGFVSVEMSRASVGFRAVSMEARVDAVRLMTGHVSPDEQRRVGDALGRLAERKLAIDDSSGQTAAAVRSKVRRLASKHQCGAVFVDYMQLLHTGGKVENRNQELSLISAGLKDLAKELNAPVVVLSQLSRDSEKGTNRRPQLWHLRDSGSLEQDADLVMLLHRPLQHEDGQRYGDGEPAELIIAKQRNGPTGTVQLQWQATTMRFVDTVRA